MIRVKYTGSREWVQIIGRNRREYFFSKDNNYIVEATDEEGTDFLANPLHRFEILPPEVKQPLPPEIPPKEKKIKEHKKRRKVNG